MRTIIFDISNIVFRNVSAQKAKYEKGGFHGIVGTEDFVGLCIHMSFMSVRKWFNKFKPKNGIPYRIVFAFEGDSTKRKNWRKTFTESSAQAISGKQYKANRVVDPSMQYVFDVLNNFRTISTEHTSVITLSVPGAEADDVIGIYCQEHASESDDIYVISGDKDFIQLLNLPNVYLVNPDDGKLRNQPGDKIYYDDIDYFLFEKCIRGDKGDNVFSAYPRVRATKIKKAYDNEFDRVNFMNETWSIENEDGTKTTYRVGDLFEENKILVDLRQQPKDIRDAVIAEINDKIVSPGKFSNFHFMKFLGEHKLNSVAQEIAKFSEIFSNNQLMVLPKEQPKQKDENQNAGLLSF